MLYLSIVSGKNLVRHLMEATYINKAGGSQKELVTALLLTVNDTEVSTNPPIDAPLVRSPEVLVFLRCEVSKRALELFD